MGAGWFFKVQLSQPAQIGALMDEAAYQSFSG
jgi:glycine cleavage system H lipoate-binding protein